MPDFLSCRCIRKATAGERAAIPVAASNLVSAKKPVFHIGFFVFVKNSVTKSLTTDSRGIAPRLQKRGSNIKEKVQKRGSVCCFVKIRGKKSGAV